MRNANYIKMDKKYWKIKFFGSKNRKEQIKQVKMFVEAPDRDKVEEILRYKHGYKMIHGLKISAYED